MRPHVDPPDRALNGVLLVDESKSRGYFLAVVAIQPGALSRTRKELNGMRRPGQRRIHCTRESDSSRRQLAGPIARLPVTGIVYVVRGADDKTARTACMRALLTDAVDAGATRIVIERDESVASADRRIIRDHLLAHESSELVYEHMSAHEEPLRWVADALAWAHQAGGDWSRRFGPITADVVRVEPSERQMREPGSSYRPEDCQAYFTPLLQRAIR
jgi:hypothetical protein